MLNFNSYMNIFNKQVKSVKIFLFVIILNSGFLNEKV